MSTEGNGNQPHDEDVLGRADALLKRHRAATASPNATDAAIPTLIEAVDSGLEGADIPTLTDIVEATDDARANAIVRVDAAVTRGLEDGARSAPEDDDRALTATPAPDVEVISRVQTQN